MNNILLFYLGGAQPSSELIANLTPSCEPPTKVPRLTEPQTNNNASSMAFDAPKRTRFTFRPEHLDVKSFIREKKGFISNLFRFLKKLFSIIHILIHVVEKI